MIVMLLLRRVDVVYPASRPKRAHTLVVGDRAHAGATPLRESYCRNLTYLIAIENLLSPLVDLLTKAAALFRGDENFQSGLTSPRQPPSCWDNSDTAGSLGAFPLIVRLRHWNGVGISEIAYSESIGFPGGYGCDRGNDRYTEGNCPDSQRNVSGAGGRHGRKESRKQRRDRCPDVLGDRHRRHSSSCRE